jgi:hypothetical protein
MPSLVGEIAPLRRKGYIREDGSDLPRGNQNVVSIETGRANKVRGYQESHLTSLLYLVPLAAQGCRLQCHCPKTDIG